jgi:hypothetical protein
MGIRILEPGAGEPRATIRIEAEIGGIEGRVLAGED